MMVSEIFVFSSLTVAPQLSPELLRSFFVNTDIFKIGTRMRSLSKKPRSSSLDTVLWLVLLAGPFVAWAQQVGSGPARPAIHAGRSVEDWSSLSLAGSDLHSEKPVLGAKDVYPEFTRELFQVQWRLGDPIDLYVIRPKGVAKPPVILYLYSYPSETDRFRDNEYCTRLKSSPIPAGGAHVDRRGKR